MYSLHVKNEINPEINNTIKPVNIPDTRKSMGNVSIVPPIMELTSVKMVLQEGFSPLFFIFKWINYLHYKF